MFFPYIIQDEVWSIDRQKESIRRYAKKKFKYKVPDDRWFYDEGRFRDESFFNRPMGFAIFIKQAKTGDILLVASHQLLRLPSGSNGLAQLNALMQVHVTSRLRLQNTCLTKREQFLKNKRQRNAPYGWIRDGEELILNNLERALAKVSLKMLEVGLQLPTQQQMREMATAAEQGFPKWELSSESKWTKIRVGRIHTELRIKILDYLERCPGRNFRAMRETIGLEYIDRKKPSKMRLQGYIKKEDDGRYFITDAGRAYLQSLREHHAELYGRPCESSPETPGPTGGGPVVVRRKHPLQLESFLEEVSRRRGASPLQLPRSSGPVPRLECHPPSTPTLEDQPVPARPPKGNSKISLEFAPQPLGPVLGLYESEKAALRSSDDERAH